jgi:hypothetical protein
MCKKLLLISILIFISINLSFSQRKNDFRTIDWGMTRDQIKSTETIQPDFENDKILAYKVKIAGFSAILVFNFISDKCINGRYLIQEKHSNNNLYIEDYNKLKVLLNKIYGEPQNDEVIWKDDLYKDKPDDYGMAICAGQLIYYSIWENEETEITMELSGDNYEVNHFVIFYDSKKFTTLVEENKTIEDTEGL